ncbi:MAG: helix-turn-helix domain-containing protein [Phycisphaerae bacterium]|nr:helix-turn-helix domain-containing protein [Phycisphaerae bacterium]
MASKMFYSAEEAAEKLGKSVNEVLEMAKRGEIQEFRDRDRLMFKVEQVNLLAGDDDVDLPLALEDSGMGEPGITLSDSGGGSASGMRSHPIKPPANPKKPPTSRDMLADSSEETGISAFDASKYGQDKAKGGSGELSLETVGSGSGLLDLTRENDDSLSGAALIEDAFSNDENVEMPANASGLFDAAGGADSGGNVVMSGGGGMAMMPMMVETYDGAWSGLGVGLMIGAFAALTCAMIMAIVSVTGAVPALAIYFTGNLAVWGGGLALAAIVCGLVGFFIGRATE